MKLSLLHSPDIPARSMWHNFATHRLTWHPGSRFSETSPKIRKRCTTTSESMDLASCWSWVSDDDDDKLSLFINIFIPSMTFTARFLCTTAKLVVRSLLPLPSLSAPAQRQRNMSTGCIVYVGVKFVNKFATVALLCVIFSIIAVYTGIFTNIHGNDRLK